MRTQQRGSGPAAAGRPGRAERERAGEARGAAAGAVRPPVEKPGGAIRLRERGAGPSGPGFTL